MAKEGQQGIAKDPIGFEGGDLSSNGYTGGDPISGIDPWSLFCIPLPKETTDWVNTKQEKPRWELQPPIFGMSVISTAYWHKKTWTTRERDERTKKWCWKCDACGENCGFETEYGEWEKVKDKHMVTEVYTTRSMCWNTDGNPTACDVWITHHPETGQPVGGTFR